MSSAGRLLATLLVAFGVGACSSAAPSAPDGTDAPQSTPLSAPPATSGAAAPTTAPTPAWRDVADAPFARLEMATAAHQGRVWLAGGLDPSRAVLNEVRIWDPAADAWSEAPSLPVPVHHAALVSDGERLILIGGYIGGASNVPTERTWVVSADGAAWEAGPPLPGVRGAGAAAWDGERVVYAGGVGPGGVAADVFVLTGDAWSEIGDLPRPREHFAAASDGDGRTWFLGGRVGSLVSNMSDVAVVQGDDVRALGSLPTPRGGVAAFFAPGIGACLTGGEAPDHAFVEVECADADGNVTTPEPMAHPRHGHGAAVVDGIAYVLLGGPTPGLSAHASIEAIEVGVGD